MEKQREMSATMETKKRSYWRPVKGLFVSKDKESGEDLRANTIDGKLTNIYVYDDPGKGKIAPSKKIVMSLSEEDEVYKIVTRVGTVYSRILVDKIMSVPANAKVKLRVWPWDKDENVTCGSVKFWDEDHGDWQEAASAGFKNGTPDQTLLDAIENHPANRKPEDRANGQTASTADDQLDSDLLNELEGV